MALADAVGGRYVRDGDEAARIAADLAGPGDVVLVMGAGDVRPVGERLLELLRTPV
jgi:UDP-N-acetylmuramate--alanine ligase